MGSSFLKPKEIVAVLCHAAQKRGKSHKPVLLSHFQWFLVDTRNDYFSPVSCIKTKCLHCGCFMPHLDPVPFQNVLFYRGKTLQAQGQWVVIADEKKNT